MFRDSVIYNIFMMFLFYGIMGWVLEVLYHVYTDKKFINRGFLHGPVCPIYGISAVIIVYILKPIQNNFIFLFLGGAIIITIIEYITGFLLEKCLGTRWWDYSDEKLNIKGYICLKFSIIWGILSVVFINMIHPIVINLITSISNQWAIAIYSIGLCIISIDGTLTIRYLFELKGILNELKQIGMEIKKNLELAKENTSDIPTIIKLKNKNKALIHRYEREILRTNKYHSNIIKAYPRVKSIKYEKHLQDIKEKLSIKSKNKF